MRSFRAIGRASVTFVGVVLLFVAVFAASYAVAHQAHQRHAQAVLVQSERSAMARIATAGHGASCQVAGVRPGPAVGHPQHSRHQPDGPGRGGHGRPGAERGRRARPGIGVARRGRRGRVPGARRQLLRAPQRAEAGRRDHVPDGLQHGEVRGERAAGRPRRLTGLNTTSTRAWSSTPAGRPTRCSSRRTDSWSGPPRSVRSPRGATCTRARSSSGPWRPPTTRPRHRRRCRRRG